MWDNFRKYVVNLIWQYEGPQQVIHTKHHDGGAEHGCVDDGEELLPVKCEDGSDNAESQYGAEGHPRRRKAVKLSNNQQDGEGEEAPQLQPAGEESYTGHQHGHQAAENSHAQADGRLCLCAQLRVQNWLRTVEEKCCSRAEREARKKHHHLEKAVTLKEKPEGG